MVPITRLAVTLLVLPFVMVLVLVLVLLIRFRLGRGLRLRRGLRRRARVRVRPRVRLGIRTRSGQRPRVRVRLRVRLRRRPAVRSQVLPGPVGRLLAMAGRVRAVGPVVGPVVVSSARAANDLPARSVAGRLGAVTIPRRATERMARPGRPALRPVTTGRLHPTARHRPPIPDRGGRLSGWRRRRRNRRGRRLRWLRGDRQGSGHRARRSQRERGGRPADRPRWWLQCQAAGDRDRDHGAAAHGERQGGRKHQARTTASARFDLGHHPRIVAHSGRKCT